MLNKDEFRKSAHEIVDWIANYYENIEQYPVKSQVKPKEIFNQLPDETPLVSESMEVIMNDFEKIIMPGVTHWQNPNFYAYFPANSSFPSILGEMLTSALALQCMKWETSPAAAELEEKVMIWLRKMIGLPENFCGVIQDSASTATLAAILTSREKASAFQINEHGFESDTIFRVYCSTETHSSVEKAVKIAGIGKKNLVKIPVDERFAMRTDLLEQAIEKDIQQGFKPVCVVAALGTTGSLAIDPLKDIAKITSKHSIWLHIDAAMAGSALVLPEWQWMINGIEFADSFVFNPHKWMFTNFDCSAYFLKDKQALLNTFQLVPEYLKTNVDDVVNNYSDWGVPLGRRFRALKLWFVLRNMGLDEIRNRIRNHINLAKELGTQIETSIDFELLLPVSLNLVCFRYVGNKTANEEKLNQLNEQLLQAINQTGKIYVTHTKLNGKYTIRMQIGQTNVTKQHVDAAWTLIKNVVQDI